MGRRPKQSQRKETSMGQHTGTHGMASASQITDADLAEFMRLKAAGPSHAAWLFVIGKHHVGKDGLPLHVNNDMVNFPATYGFASAEDVKGYFATIETAK